MSDRFIGRKLDDRYEIQELLGEGGMANVYKGLDTSDNRIVAIKVLKDEFNSNAELVRRFKNESRAISVLNHPNIVKVFDISVSDTLQYIVMEYIDGITLKAYIEQRGEPLTYKETVHFTSQVLRALQHAHDKGIVHRDIKPQNIMLMPDGNVKVMDFGIARLSRSESHTVTDQAIGSVHYISPEQAKGDLTDPRADIYSLGITMYEMLSGTLPFEDDNAVSIAIKQISDDAEPLRKVNPSVPPGLESITTKAMEKDPRKRYQGALDMLRDIEEFRRNPNIKFEYAGAGGSEATRYVNTVGKNSNGGKPSQGAGKRPIKKKRKLLVPITAAVTFIIVATCAILILNIFQGSGNPLFGSVPEMPLPKFVGMQLQDVENMLQQEQYKNFRLQKVEFVYKPGVPKGEVISQNPTPPKQVKVTQKIYLVVSKGIDIVEMQDLAGMTRAEATQAVLDMGMRPYVKSIVDENVPVGKVIGTSPAAGSSVETDPEAIVEIYVSAVKRDVKRDVPDLIGVENSAEAKKILTQNDLQFGTPKEEHSDTYPAGAIIAQHPEPGKEVDIYTTVYVTISLGAPPPPPPTEAEVPSVVGMTAAEAGAALAAHGFVYAEGEPVFSDVPAGRVAIQSVPAATKLAIGATVTVNISMGPVPPIPPTPSTANAENVIGTSAPDMLVPVKKPVLPQRLARLNDGYYI